MKHVNLSSLVFVLGAMVISSQSWAGHSVRNGGDVVVCDRGTPNERIATLDLYEADGESAFTLKIEGSSASDKLQTLLGRLAKYSPRRAQIYAQMATDFAAPENTIAGPFPTVDDLGGLRRRIPSNCLVVQAAVQVPRDLGQSGRRALFNQAIVAQMSADAVASLYLHELIFMELSAWGLHDSSAFRPFTAKVADRAFSNLTFKGFLRELFRAGFTTYEYGTHAMSFIDEAGQNVWPSFYDDSHIRMGIPVFNSLVHVGASDIGVAGQMTFARDGSVRQFVLASDRAVAMGGQIIALPSRASVTMAADGEVIAARAVREFQPAPNQPYLIRETRDVNLGPDGVKETITSVVVL